MPSTIKALFDTTVKSLHDDLSRYWPSKGNNDISESTPLVHLGAACKQNGWCLYREVQMHNAPKQHIDMFLYHPDTKIALAVEGKKLFSKNLDSVIQDWDRLDNFRVLKRHGPINQGFRCILGTTFYHDSIMEWRERNFKNATHHHNQIHNNMNDWGPYYLHMIFQEVSHKFQ